MSNRKMNKAFVLSPVVAAMFAVAGNASADTLDTPAIDGANTASIAATANIDMDLAFDQAITYLDTPLDLAALAAGDVKCTFYSNTGGEIKCTFYSQSPNITNYVGDEGVFDV